MHHDLITDLALVTMIAAVIGLFMRRIGQPSVLGYLLAGLVVGPYIPIPLFADPDRIKELAEVGVVFVMFAVGLEFRVKHLLEILPRSGFTAVLQIAALGWAGFGIGSVLGWTTQASVCLGASVAISSTMVVSAVLRSKPVDPDTRTHIFGVLVIQDVAAIVLMALITAMAAGQSIEASSIGLMLGQLAGVIVGMLVIGTLVLPPLVRFALRQSDREALAVLVAGAAFGLAYAAHLFGYSVALGAFICGMAIAESGKGHEVEHAIEPLRALFSAIFFVSIGMTVDPMVAWEAMPLALALCATVIGMQLLSVSLGTLLTGGSLRRSVISGLALGQVGELSFIIAGVGIAGGVLPKQTLPALVTVATVTAFTTPFLLNRSHAIVNAIDHLTPDRVHQVLATYQAALRRPRQTNRPALFRPVLRSILLDWLALAVLFILHRALLSYAAPSWKVALDVGAVVLAVPFLVGLIRNALALAKNVQVLARGSDGPNPRADAVEPLGWLAVMLGVGAPTLALLQPAMDGPWAEVALLSGVLAVLVTLGVRLSHVKGIPIVSGVEGLAKELAERVGEDPTDAALFDYGPLAGLDYHPLPLSSDSPALGLSLIELDLRSRTGATIVAISRDGKTIALPAGDERLEAADVLAISGSPEALARARSALDLASMVGGGPAQGVAAR